MSGMQSNNLYYPVMYLIESQMKRYFNGEGSNVLPKDVIEPVKLHRDERGRLQHVEGWEYIDVELTFSDKGILDYVDIKHRITNKHLKMNLLYDDRMMLDEVVPEMIDQGLGEPGEMDIPDVIADY